MNNKNNIWLYTFNKSASTAVRKPIGGKVNRPTTPVKVKEKSPQEYAAENQQLEDNKSMSTMEYMKKYHPQTDTQTTTNNQDGSVTNSRKDNKGNFVNVTTPAPKTKSHWTDAYKNNPEKIDSAKQQMNNTKLELDDINDQIALIQKQMNGYGNTPGDQYNKKMLNYKLYELQQKQRSIQATYDKQQMGWKQLERRGYTSQPPTTTPVPQKTPAPAPTTKQTPTTNTSAKHQQPPTETTSTKSYNNVLNFKAGPTPAVKLPDAYKALGVQPPSDDLDNSQFMKEFEADNNISNNQPTNAPTQQITNTTALKQPTNTTTSNRTTTNTIPDMEAIYKELGKKGVGDNWLARWFQNIFRRPGYYV